MPIESLPLTQFLDQVYRPAHINAQPESLAQIGYAIRALERWAERTIATTDLTTGMLRQFLSDYRTIVSASTVNAKRRHLLALWRQAHADGYVACGPGKIEACVVDLPVPEAWTAGQFGLILEIASSEPGTIAGLPASAWWRSLLLTLYYTGERIGALLRVAPTDFKFSRPGMLPFAAAGVLVRRRKTHQGKFHCLPADVMDVCMLIYDSDRKVMWPVPWSRESRDERLRRILRQAGVAFGRPRGGLWHKIRRTTGSLVEAAGGDGSKMLGNTRAIFEAHYRDPRICGGSQVNLLPPPTPIGRPRFGVVG